MSTTIYTRPEPAAAAGVPVVAAPKAIPAQTGVWVAVSAIAMSFAALTSALVVRQASGTDWQRFVVPRILYLDTVILIASSYTLELSRKRFAAGCRTSHRIICATSGCTPVERALLAEYYADARIVFRCGASTRMAASRRSRLVSRDQPEQLVLLPSDGDAWPSPAGRCSGPDLRGIPAAP